MNRHNRGGFVFYHERNIKLMLLRKILLQAVSAFMLLGMLFSAHAVIIPAHASHFQYSGRINFADPEKPLLYWPGSSIKAVFTGSSIAIILDDTRGESYYNVFLDGDFAQPVVINCLPGKQSYEISPALKDTVHVILIFRRTEASTGPTRFLGLELSEGGTLLPPPPKPAHRILFYGDSITCGMGNEAPDDSGDANFAEENNYLAYGAITARMLDAEYMCIAKSGIGIMISWFDLIMPDYYFRLDPDDPNSRYDYNQFTPDVVVINLLQNDSWLYTKLNPVPTPADIIQAYASYVRSMRSHHPDAFIICALGSMDATRAGSPWPGYIEQAVAELKRVDNDANLGICFFPFTGWGKHPRVRHHAEMGNKLAQYLSNEMDWKLKE